MASAAAAMAATTGAWKRNATAVKATTQICEKRMRCVSTRGVPMEPAVALCIRKILPQDLGAKWDCRLSMPAQLLMLTNYIDKVKYYTNCSNESNGLSRARAAVYGLLSDVRGAGYMSSRLNRQVGGRFSGVNRLRMLRVVASSLIRVR